MGVGGHAEEPGRDAEFGGAGVEGLVQAVEVPPAGAVGDEGEAAVGVEARLLDGLGSFGVAAGDGA